MISIAIFNERQYQQVVLASSVTHLGYDPDRKSDPEVSPDFLFVDDPSLAGNQLTLKQVVGSPGQVELINHGRSLALSSGTRIHTDRQTISLPVTFSVGDTHIQIVDAAVEQALDTTLTSLSSNAIEHRSASKRPSPGPATLKAWLDSLSELQQASAGSQQLFKLAASAVFNPGGLDGGIIFVRRGKQWEVAASHLPYPDHGIAYCSELVQQVATTGETLYHTTGGSKTVETSAELHAAVACPVIDSDNQIVAIIYGFRSLHRRNTRRGVRFLEAQFVQVVADSLSAAMIRLESEVHAARSMVLLEQAFAPDVARQLQTNPEFLQGTTREVTVLFADLRGFTTLAEEIGAQQSYDFLSDLMDQLSAVISDHDGVIIDFYGDGISAFWNAPMDQPEHAVLACHCAFEILNCLPGLNQRWQRILGRRLKVGIGIHTGDAHVGNSGSRLRLKYGPRGTTVNLASRLESMSKQVGVPILVSGETAKQVAHAFDTVRIIRARPRGLSQSTNISQVFAKSADVKSNSFYAAYAEALQLFEAGDLSGAEHNLSQIAAQWPNEPLVKFLAGAVSAQHLGGNEVRLIGEDTRVPGAITLPFSVDHHPLT